MAPSAPRLKDIAEETGFSVNTVSLALRGSPRLPDETRRKILQAADKLNYLPNQVAQSLVTKQTKSIGLILTDIADPVLTSVARSVELELSKRGYITLFATSNYDPDLEQRMIASFLSRRADGMLIFPCNHRDIDHIRQLRARNYPVVLLVGDPDAGVDAVCMDERTGAFKAISHLLSLGHRRIAIFDGAGQEGNQEKLDGYRAAHMAREVAFDQALVIAPNGHDVQSGYDAMSALIAKKVGATAVMCTTDSAALGALRYCVLHNIAVPEEMSIFGFDNTEFGKFAVIALSSVNYDINAISTLAIERVLDLIKTEGDLPTAKVTQVEPVLVIRESTASLIPST